MFLFVILDEVRVGYCCYCGLWKLFSNTSLCFSCKNNGKECTKCHKPKPLSCYTEGRRCMHSMYKAKNS